MTTRRFFVQLLMLAPLILFDFSGVTPVTSMTANEPGGKSVHAPDSQTPAAIPIFQDTFEDGDFTKAAGAGGLTWSLVAGAARVERVNGSLQLGVDRGYSLIATTQRMAVDEYTLRFDGRIIWSAPGRIVVLYKDASNYYSIGLGEQPGIYRKLNGNEVHLHEDPESLIRLPHGPGETGAFKVYAHNTGQDIVLKADRAGDGVDYDIEIVDADPAAVAKFRGTAIGMLSSGDQPDTPWFYIDNVAVYEGRALDPYEPATYFVDRNHSQASDGNPGTESQPWLTIQHAANSVRAGDTVIVKAGSYDERITFESGRRGAPGQVIVFKAQPRRSVTMWGFYTQYAHYLRIEGFNITTHPSLTGWTEQNGVFISSDHVEVVDNYLYNLKGAAISGTAAGAIVKDNHIYHSQMGIVISGSGWLVEGNEVERLYMYGDGDCDYSRFFGEDHMIRHNFFHGTLFNEIGSAHVDCFQTFDNNGEYAHHVTFDGNVCTDFHQGFMGEAAYHHNISDLLFQNNIFVHGEAWGLCVLQIRNVTAVHNVFADIRFHGMGFRDGATGVVRNNIFYNAGSNYWASEGGTVEGSHNLLYSTTGTIEAKDFPGDLVNLDPRFADPASDDYHPLEDSPAINAGMNAGVNTDLEGRRRPQEGGYDIGAYEFVPALQLAGWPGNKAIHLRWEANLSLSPSTTWEIRYGDQFPPINGLPESMRAYDLTGLTNYVIYQVTLTGWLNGAPVLADTVTVMPTDVFLFLPGVSGPDRPAWNGP
jgi:hypothetical protein